jgi:hypothetical protein
MNRAIAYIGDSNTTGLNNHYFDNFNPFWMRSDAPALCQDVDPVDVFGNPAYPASITLYADGTATWTAPGDTAGPRTRVQYGSDRQLVYLESATPQMGIGVYFTQAEMLAASPTGTLYEFYIMQGLNSGSVRDYGSWAQALSGWRFELSGCYGISGNTAEDLMPRLGDVFAVNSVGQPLNKKPDIVVVNIGTNGCNDLDIYDAIKDYVVSNGAKVIFCTVAQESPAAPTLAFVQSIRDRLLSIADGDCAVADFYAVTMSVGAAIPGRMDGLHYLPNGALQVGKELNRVFESLYGAVSIRSDFQSPSDASNLWPSGMMTGTSGALTGIAGVSAVDAAYTSSGTGVCVASKESVYGENDWQVFTITGASELDSLTIGDSSGATLISASIGKSFLSQIEMQVSGSGLALMKFGGFVFNDIDPPYKAITSCAILPSLDHLETITEFTVLHKTTVTPVPTWKTQSSVSNSYLLAAGDTVIKVRNGGVRQYYRLADGSAASK